MNESNQLGSTSRMLAIGLAIAISSSLFGQEKSAPEILVVPKDGLSTEEVAVTQKKWGEFLETPCVQKNPAGMTLALIPPGEFDLGIRKEQELKVFHYCPELPLGTNEHGYRVRLTRPFWMSAYEVTKSQLSHVTHKRRADLDDKRPAMVSFFAAIEFCNRLSEMCEISPYYKVEASPTKDQEYPKISILGGTGYRLPSDAEWEYACRAGTVSHFSFGDSCNGTEANINSEEPFGTVPLGAVPAEDVIRRGFRTPVGSFAPNAFGLFDMHGSVPEWIDEQWVEERTKSEEVVVNPQLPWIGGPELLTTRGGAFFEPAAYARSSARLGRRPSRNFPCGIRVVRTIEAESR